MGQFQPLAVLQVLPGDLGCAAHLPSWLQVALLCGPPGLGKTTLAHVVARHAGYCVVEMNARCVARFWVSCLVTPWLLPQDFGAVVPTWQVGLGSWVLKLAQCFLPWGLLGLVAAMSSGSLAV